MSSWVHPGAILILGSLLIPFIKGKAKKFYLLLLPALAFIDVAMMDKGVYGVFNLLGQDLIFGRVDNLSYVFAFIFTLATFIWMVYGLHVDNDGHHIAAFVYAGSAVGVALAGDYLTLFIFWEFMAFSSIFLILYRNLKESTEAAYRYILVHTVSGVCLLGGLVLQYFETGSFAFDAVNFGGLAALLLLVAFIINAAVPPFGAWLPDAYPRATVTGAIFMTTFTTKSAVYVLARGFAGNELLLWMGAIMTIYGVVYAVLENDIRRLLAYHIISQVGYMVAAVGIGTNMGVNGAVAHAFAHILYKGLLFMGAGSILYMTGKSKLTELGGLYKTMPWTFLMYMVGAFAISSVPFFSGFVSKSLVTGAAAEAHLTIPFLILTLSATGTFLSLGLKLPYFAFLSKDAGIKTTDPPRNMLIGMGIASFLCIFLGLYPQPLYALLPYPVDYHPYTAEHLVWTFQLLLFTWFAFYLYIDKLGGKDKISLDTDWFYRRGASGFMWITRRVIAPVDDVVSNAYKTLALASSLKSASLSLRFDLGVVDGIVNGIAAAVLAVSKRLRKVQTGQLQHYVAAILIGLIVLLNLVFILP